MTPAASFQQIVEAGRKGSPLPASLLALDPGQTTGWCLFKGIRLMAAGEIEDNNLIENLILTYQPEVVVAEEFKLYPWKAKHQSWQPMVAPQAIGVIQFLCKKYHKTLVFQPPATAKGFFTDQKLHELNLWYPGLKHARDAIRHAAYFLVFGGNKVGQK